MKKIQYDKNGIPILKMSKKADPLPEAIVDYLNTKYPPEKPEKKDFRKYHS